MTLFTGHRAGRGAPPHSNDVEAQNCRGRSRHRPRVARAGTVFHDAHDPPVRALDLETGATSTAAAAPDDDSMDARAASSEEESGSDDESETERFNAEDAFHECYVCGVYAGGDAIQLECSHLRPSFAQAYSCTDRAGCVARAEERVRVAQAELEYAQGRLALAHERGSE